MAKPEIPLKGGDEYDFLTKWRHFIVNNHFKVKKVKRKYWKRVRRNIKNKLNRYEG